MKIPWSEVYKNCVSDQIQWSEINKIFTTTVSVMSENVVSNYKITFRAESNVDKLSFLPNCALSDKSTKIGRGRFVCFE